MIWNATSIILYDIYVFGWELVLDWFKIFGWGFGLDCFSEKNVDFVIYVFAYYIFNKMPVC